MTRPTDHPSEKEENASEVKRFKIRKGVMINPGFRENPADSSENAPHHHVRRFANPQDRKNFFYGIIALVVVVVILSLLEIKQLHDASLEKPLQTTAPAAAEEPSK